MKPGAAAGSLVELDLCTHSPLLPGYPGYEWDLAVRLNSVRIVYLSRFIDELLCYFGSLLPNPLPLEHLPEHIREIERRKRGKAVQVDIRLTPG